MALSFEGLSFSYKDEPALVNINLKIGHEFLAIMGQNGSGKSTLLKCANGVIPKLIKGKFQGTVKVFGEDVCKKPVSKVAQDAGIVFQNPDSQLFALSVEEELAFALENMKLPREQISARILESLKMVGMEGFEGRDPQELSMGQKQRIAIASVLVMRPRILLLDEPFSLLDNKSSKEIFRILGALYKSGTTIVLVDHNWQRVRQLGRLAVLDRGKLILDGKPSDVSKESKFKELEFL